MKKITTFLTVAVFSLILAQPSQASVVTGKVDFTGTAPAPTKINMDADPTCAGLHDDAVYTQEVLVNSNNTLKNVFVYVKEGLEGKTFETPSEPVELDQLGCQYHPHVLGIQVDQPLQMINGDSTLHNVHSMPKESKEFNLGMPIKGMKLKKKFSAPEVMVKFKCDVHPWMSAYVGVLNHPYYSVSGDDGTFSLKDLPAGTYTIEAWHETYGTQTQQVTVVDGQDSAVDFTFAG